MTPKQLKTLLTQNVALAKACHEFATIINNHATILEQFNQEIVGLNEDINTLAVAVSKLRDELPISETAMKVR